jgi:hypothetical protein
MRTTNISNGHKCVLGGVVRRGMCEASNPAVMKHEFFCAKNRVTCGCPVRSPEIKIYIFAILFG